MTAIQDGIVSVLGGLAGHLDDLADLYDRIAGELDRQENWLGMGDLQAQAKELRDQRIVLDACADDVTRAADDTEALGAGLTCLADLRDFARPLRNDFDTAVGEYHSEEVSRARARLRRLSEDVEAAIGELTGGEVPDGTSRGSLRKISDSVQDIASYPILTSQDTLSAPSGGAVQPIQRTVDSAIRATLGRLPKYTDHTAFTNALNSSFDVVETQGRTQAIWRPRSYVGQNELGGGVTGAQASLYSRARDAQKAVLPLIKALTPLRADADQQEMDAVRGILETQFSAAVEELGMEGGPRKDRVDELFRVLLVDPVVGVDGQESAGGMIGYAAGVFGIDSDAVNTPDEERVFSDFLLLTDHIDTIRKSWEFFRDNVFGKDLGTHLVLLSNALQVVAESADSTEATFDSVFVGPAERTVASFPTSGGGKMLISELLSWITSFSTQEARELVQQGGRRALGAIVSKADTLEARVRDLQRAAQDGTNLPDGVRHPRVRFALQELATYLRQVSAFAKEAKATKGTAVTRSGG
jgi:hypothetical protein